MVPMVQTRNSPGKASAGGAGTKDEGDDGKDAEDAIETSGAARIPAKPKNATNPTPGDDAFTRLKERCCFKEDDLKISTKLVKRFGDTPLDHDTLMRLCVILVESHKGLPLAKFLETGMPSTSKNVRARGRTKNVKDSYVRTFEEYAFPFRHVSTNYDKNYLTKKLKLESTEEPSTRSVLELTSAPKQIPLPKVSALDEIKLENVSEFISTVSGGSFSPLFLALFINMGAYKDKDLKQYSPPCFFSQPNVNNRNVDTSRVTTIAKGLYDETVIFGFEEDYVVFPYCIRRVHHDLTPGCKLESLVLPEDAGLYTDDEYEVCFIYECQECDYLLELFFGDKTLILPEEIEKDSFEDYNFRFALFLEKLSNKYNSFRDLKDWKSLTAFLTKTLNCETLFPVSDRSALGELHHHSRIMMNSLTSNRLGGMEGDHRFLGMLMALYNRLLYTSVESHSELEYSHILSENELKEPKNKFCASKISALAKVTFCWPSSGNKAHSTRINSKELNVLKLYSSVMQDKKSGTVNRSIKDVMLGYLKTVKDISVGEDLFGDYHKVHIPGSLRAIKWELKSMQEMGLELYKPNPSKEELEPSQDQDEVLDSDDDAVPEKQVKKGRRKKKKVAKKVPESEDDSEKKPAAKNTLDEDDTSVAKRNKYRYDDDSAGLEARAMVSFREKILDYIISQPIPEVTTILKKGESIFCRLSDDTDQTGRDPKNPNKPKKLLPKDSTSLHLAKFIGYTWTIDRSVEGCYTGKNLKWNSLSPGHLFTLVFLITNFVHDADSLDLMIKILSTNGAPANQSQPFDISELPLPTYPSIFRPGLLDYGHQIVYGFLKPQTMLYDTFFACFIQKYKSASEGVIRNRFMLAIGKCWLRVVYKYGLWITPTAIPACHKPLKDCFVSPGAEKLPNMHINESDTTGTNLPQVAAYICHLIQSGAFVWDSSQKFAPTEKNGAYSSKHKIPEDWECFEPRFKLGSKAKQCKDSAAEVVFKIDDIVDFIFLKDWVKDGKTLETTRKSIDLFEDWNKKFSLEVCSEYIGLNKLPVAKDTIKQTTGLVSHFEVRSDAAFRRTLFNPVLYKKYLSRGNPKEEDQELGRLFNEDDEPIISRRLDQMADTLLEASLFMRFQKHLLNRSINDDDVKKKGWNFAAALDVLKKQGAESCHSMYDTKYLDSHDYAMDQLAGLAHEEAKTAARAGRKGPLNGNAVMVAATNAAYAFDNGTWKFITEKVKKRKSRKTKWALALNKRKVGEVEDRKTARPQKPAKRAKRTDDKAGEKSEDSEKSEESSGKPEQMAPRAKRTKKQTKQTKRSEDELGEELDESSESGHVSEKSNVYTDPEGHVPSEDGSEKTG